jgi:hypothetical protein
VGQDANGEFVILVTEQVQAGTDVDEAYRDKLIQFRLPSSDTCDAQNHQADLDSCGLQIAGQEIDALAKPNGMPTVKSRIGIWEAKPSAFVGRTPDGTVDSRVGVVWYSQPYKGRMSATDEMRARTIVEAVVSTDGGLTYSGPFNINARVAGDQSPESDPEIGDWFWPCQLLCSSYFGEYISGVFQFSTPTLTAIAAAWGDSREGCIDQSATTQHQHVWAGAVRAVYEK